jgi:curli production assembly/transport component CsgF
MTRGGLPQPLLNPACQAGGNMKEQGMESHEVIREALERNIINSLTRRIADGDLVEGVYNTGEYLIEVTLAPDGSVIVNITNLNNGEVTIITIPVIGG